MEIHPGIHHFNTGPFNWYLIEEAGRLTLVDAGFPGHYPVFLEGLRAIGRSLADVDAVILTHAHADHTGFAERVRRETKAEVFIHHADVAAVGRVLQLPWMGLLSHAWRPFTGGMIGRAVAYGLFRLASVSRARAFNDGDVLDVPGRPQVLHVPGHTPGEVAFYLPARRVLLSGDTLVTRNLITGEHTAPQLPHHSLNHDHKLAGRALDRFRELGHVTMLPGHGRPWVGSMAVAVAGAR
ncbi:MAG: MBL fold metallo-hydrolase [bacterium]|nr:MBL fold metallo-hydrolase [bacterium]